MEGVYYCSGGTQTCNDTTGDNKETCNGRDDNCNGQIDEGLPMHTYYADTDGDTYGDPDNAMETCLAQPPSDYVIDSSDCEDDDSTINPGAEEIYNGVDDDCDGLVLNSIDMFLKLIPAGTFIMGSPENELGRGSDEIQHRVTLTRPFYIQNTEVTQGQWAAVMGEGTNPSSFSECGGDCPVEMVTWYDCAIFCNRLSQQEGLTPSYYTDSTFLTVFTGSPPVTSGTVYLNKNVNGYRLPTEAEWEYATRAGTESAYYTGNSEADLGRAGWYPDNSGNATQRVRQKEPNAFGLYDMHGNVWEWCQDWYGAYREYDVTDPAGPSTGSDRVFRGGSWGSLAMYCRSATRYWYMPGYRSFGLGFRLALPPGQ